MAQSTISFPRLRGLPNTIEENKCFFNAVIQCLARTSDFITKLQDSDKVFYLPDSRITIGGKSYRLPPISVELAPKGLLTSALVETLNELQEFDREPYNPEVLFGIVTNLCPQFADSEQHDCHEFLRFLLENIKSEDLNRFSLKDRHTRLGEAEERAQYMKQATEQIFSGNMFRGSLVSILTCQDCSGTTKHYEDFLDLSLPTHIDTMVEVIPKKRARIGKRKESKKNKDLNCNVVVADTVGNGKVGADETATNPNDGGTEQQNGCVKEFKTERIEFPTIEQCLDNFTAPETMDEQNKVGCARCKTRTNTTKQYLIEAPPSVLILHLKRFHFSDRLRKVTHHVKFPIRLDLTKYRATTGMSAEYSLYGVVQHSQRGKSGHYIAFVKVRPNMTADDPRWQLLNKSKRQRGRPVRKNSAESVSTSSFDEIETSTVHAVDTPPRSPSSASDTTVTAETPYQWYRVSDNDVKTVTEAEVLKIQAYLLFYKRM